MCGRAYSPRFLWMWPNARISIMGGETAASASPPYAEISSRRRTRSLQESDPRAIRAPGPPYYASARLWDDGVVDPAASRRLARLAISASLMRDRRDEVRRVPDVSMVLLENKAGVAWVTLNRPECERFRRFPDRGIEGIFGKIEKDQTIRAMVLAGNARPSAPAPTSMDEAHGGLRLRAEPGRRPALAECWRRSTAMPKRPSRACTPGVRRRHRPGCRLRHCGRHAEAKFCFSEAKLGLSPAHQSARAPRHRRKGGATLLPDGRGV